MVTEIPEAAKVSSTNGSGKEEEMDNGNENHDNSFTANASPEAVTHDPIEIHGIPAILTEFRTDAKRDDLIFGMRDEVVQQSDALKEAQAETEAIPKTVEVQIESAVSNLVESLPVSYTHLTLPTILLV